MGSSSFFGLLSGFRCGSLGGVSWVLRVSGTVTAFLTGASLWRFVLGSVSFLGFPLRLATLIPASSMLLCMCESASHAWVCLLGSVLECVSGFVDVTRLTCMLVGLCATVVSAFPLQPSDVCLWVSSVVSSASLGSLGSLSVSPSMSLGVLWLVEGLGTLLLSLGDSVLSGSLVGVQISNVGSLEGMEGAEGLLGVG